MSDILDTETGKAFKKAFDELVEQIGNEDASRVLKVLVKEVAPRRKSKRVQETPGEENTVTPPKSKKTKKQSPKKQAESSEQLAKGGD